MALQKTPLTNAPANVSVPVPSNAKASPAKGLKQTSPSSRAFWVGLGASIAWVGAVLGVIAKAGPTHDIGGVPLADLALGVSAAVSPVAMVWMITAYLQRAADIQTIADPLRRQLALITGESGAADARIRRFNQAIREQIELLRSAQTVSQDDLEAIMERVRTHRAELEKFENVSTQQVKDIQDVIRRSMLQVEQMMDDKFTMLKFLDGKLQQNGDGVSRQVETMRDQAARLLEEIEQIGARMADTLDRAQRDSKKLADTSRLQESSLTNAAESAVEALGGLTSKIDLSVARFLERASTAREEAERLAGALDAQTRALDDLTSTLPGRVSEAETVLRGVADRLYSSEQLAREQAVALSSRLEHQLDGLQGFMDRFTARMSDIDTTFDRRHSDLDQLTGRINAATGGFMASWEKSLDDISDRAGNSLLRFTVVNDETRRNAEAAAAHLSDTTSKYEDVVTRMRALSQDSNTHMQGVTEEITRQLTQFESLSKASASAGEEVQNRANAALQNLQHVLERVLTAREATQAVGETLVKDIYEAVDQNEKMIARLNDAAQASVRTIGAATESLGRQENELAGKARASEAVLVESVQKLQQQAEQAGSVLRDQTASLMSILADAQGQLVATDHKLQNFAANAIAPVQKAVQQIDVSAEQGLRTVSRYGEGISQQVARLQEFNSRIGEMSEEMGRTTAQSAGTFQELYTRFSAVRTEQEESVRQTLAQFTDLSGRLQGEVSGLDSQAARAVESLQEAALKVGEQSYQMLENVRNSGAQMKDVAAALQVEAAQIQAALHQQAEAVNTDLARAEQKFTTIGETIRERADAAQLLIDHAAAHYGETAENVFTRAEQKFMAVGEVVREHADAATALLDRTAAHYSVTSQNTSQDLESRVFKVDQAVAHAQSRLEQLQSSFDRQADAIDVGATKIEAHASEIAEASSRAVQNLSTLNDKVSVTHESTQHYTQQILAKVEECNAQFERHTRGMAEAAQTATSAVQQASKTFGEEAGKLIDGGYQVDGVLRQLTTATSSLAEQAAQIRIGMEQQNARLLTQLADSVAQMDVTGSKLQQVVAIAISGADQTSTRFSDVTETTSKRINAATQELYTIAERTEATLAALGANVSQQAASLTVASEQMGEQQRILAAANENQRAQMTELFEKLRNAHAQASEVAERSIAHLNSSLQEIHRQMGIVGDKSQEAVGTVKMASIGFTDQAAILLQNAQAAEAQARTILTVTSALQEQAHDLRESLQVESDRSCESLGALLNRLTSGGHEVRELGASASAVFTGLQRAIGEQTSELGSSMQQISDRQKTLTAALDAQREAINGLLSRLTLAQDETAATAERTTLRLSEGVQQITRQVETLDARAQSAMANVQAASTSFATEAESIETHARQAEQQTRSIVATASGLGIQIQDMRTSLQTEGERTNLVLGTLLDKVSSGATEIRNLSGSTEMSLTSLGNAVTQQSSALSNAMQQITDRQRSLGVALDAQRDVVNGLLNRLTLAQDETAAVGVRVAAQLSEGAEQIAQQAENIDTRAQGALVNVRAATTGFAQETEALEAHARRAELQARSIYDAANGLGNQIADLRAGMQADGEYTRDAIQRLVSAMTSGSEDMRTTGASAEVAMASLQQAIGTQANAFGTTMAAIDERQQKLVETLDAQREAIHMVLNRLTLAQDETTSLAEHTVERLADSTARIGKQMQDMGTQITVAVDNVQTATTDFAQQAGLLNAQSLHIEQQMRGLLSVTSGMQQQAGHLREAMQVESARIIEQIGGVISQLEVSSVALKSESGAATETLNNAAQQFASISVTGSDMLRQQSEAASQTAEHAETRVMAAGETIRGHLRLVADMGEQAEQQARQLADSAEFATTRLVALRDSMAANDKEGQAIVASTATRIDELKAALQSELNHLAQVANESVAQVSAATHNLAEQSNALRANVGASESALTEAANAVREEASRLPAAMNRSVSEIETATRVLKTQTAEADQALIGTADRFISVTATARNNMIDEMQRVSGIADDAGKVLTHYGQMLAEQIAAMQQSAAMLTGEQKELVEKASASLTALASAGDRLGTLRTEAADTAERLVREFDILDQRSVASVNRLTQTGEGVAKQVEALGDAAARAENQLSGATDTFRDQFERIRTGLQAQIDDINRGLMQITAQLERTGASLRSTAVGAVADVERVGTRFEETSGMAESQIAERTHKMQEATVEVGALLANFDTQMEAMLARMATAGEGIKMHEGDAITQMQNMLTHLGGVAEKLEATRQMSGNVSQHAIERLDEVVNAVQTHMTNMTTGAQTAAGIMRGINQIYSDQTQALNKGVGDAHTQVVSMNKSIDDMQQRADRMRSALKLQGDELMMTLRQILVQLEMTGDGLSDAVDRTLEQQASANLKKMV